jgi:hypothetical protein
MTFLKQYLMPADDRGHIMTTNRTVPLCPMRRRLAICLLLLHLIGSTAFGELLRLPALVQHYQEHRSANWSLGIEGFVALHYAPDSDHQQSDPADHDLPFRSPDAAGKLMSLLALAESPADNTEHKTGSPDHVANADHSLRSQGNPDPQPRPPRTHA